MDLHLRMCQVLHHSDLGQRNTSTPRAGELEQFPVQRNLPHRQSVIDLHGCRDELLKAIG